MKALGPFLLVLLILMGCESSPSPPLVGPEGELIVQPPPPATAQSAVNVGIGVGAGGGGAYGGVGFYQGPFALFLGF
ncbi:hypothetical protein [Sedimentitalea todarodis]|uniref:Lipoprotein n=1 Tax=Sedimentitalea todarodis TaxID=1631240 RepID=A0ABU3VI12_9RHOB|nr:hypothetical protein [Sedimentitalea todarodis]MDU9005822.1 hypothetical protein [Sedimentitalea todarodis]